MRIVAQFFLLVLTVNLLFAAPTNVVRIVHPQPRLGLIPAKAEFKELVDATIKEFKQSPVQINHAELVAWSVKLDHLDCPPRLFEDAVILLNVITETGTNRWGIAYVWRMPGGGLAVGAWRVPDYPSPLVTFSEYESQPSDEAVARFVKATDFGFNSFNPDAIVVDVVLYWHSALLEKILKEGISAKEKRERYLAYVQSRGEPIPQQRTKK